MPKTLEAAFIPFGVDFQYKNGLRNCQANASSRLRTKIEAGMAIVELGNTTFEAPGVSECNFTHSKFEMNENLLITQPSTSKKPAYEPVDLATLEQELLCDLFCRQFWNVYMRVDIYSSGLVKTVLCNLLYS